MKKRILALLLALTMVMSFAACSSGSGSSSSATTDAAPAASDPAAAPAASAPAATTEAAPAASEPAAAPAAEPAAAGSEPVTLTWALWDKESTAYWQAMADGYMAGHPNVTIDMLDLGSQDYMTQLATQLAGGSGELDILSIKDIPGYANLINLEMLEPMNGKLARPESDFNGIIEQITASNGNYYAVPFRSDFWVTFYNKDLFDKAGVAYPSNDMTLEDFDALARQMTSGSGPDKVYGNHYHTWRSAVSLFGILDGKHTVLDGNYDFLKPVYDMVIAQQNDGIVMDYGEIKTAGLHYSAAFENGQTAMCNMGSWFIATLQTYNKEAAANGVEPVNFGIAKYPHPAGAPAGSTLGTITSLAINAMSSNKDAALDFINWCVSDEGAAVIANTGTFPAVSNSSINDIIAATEGFPSDAGSKEALTTSAVYLEMGLSDKASEIETVLNAHHDAIMTGSESVDEGIAGMNEEVAAVLAG